MRRALFCLALACAPASLAVAAPVGPGKPDATAPVSAPAWLATAKPPALGLDPASLRAAQDTAGLSGFSPYVDNDSHPVIAPEVSIGHGAGGRLHLDVSLLHDDTGVPSIDENDSVLNDMVRAVYRFGS